MRYICIIACLALTACYPSTPEQQARNFAIWQQQQAYNRQFQQNLLQPHYQPPPAYIPPPQSHQIDYTCQQQCLNMGRAFGYCQSACSY